MFYTQGLIIHVSIFTELVIIEPHFPTTGYFGVPKSSSLNVGYAQKDNSNTYIITGYDTEKISIARAGGTYLFAMTKKVSLKVIFPLS